VLVSLCTLEFQDSKTFSFSDESDDV